MINLSAHEFWFAAIAGFLLFALDIVALAWGARRLLYRGKKGVGAFWAAAALGGKFFLLGGGLYVFLIVLKWPGAGVALGATICLACVAMVGKQKLLCK